MQSAPIHGETRILLLRTKVDYWEVCATILNGASTRAGRLASE
jgi:hypothetical protein